MMTRLIYAGRSAGRSRGFTRRQRRRKRKHELPTATASAYATAAAYLQPPLDSLSEGDRARVYSRCQGHSAIIPRPAI